MQEESNKTGNEFVILSNGSECDKMAAHIMGLQHYAFSVLLFNSRDEILLQQRAKIKYHSPGLWSNACCGHPSSIENTDEIKACASNRLAYEMGIKVNQLQYAGSVSYSLKCGELTENEIDSIFIGHTDDMVIPHPDEVDDYKWVSIEYLTRDLVISPEKYTPWLSKVLEAVKIANNTDCRCRQVGQQ